MLLAFYFDCNTKQIHPQTLAKIPILFVQLPGHAVFSGVIESQEYYGLFIKYTIQAAGQTLKVVEKNSGVNIYEPGDRVVLYIDPADVMSY